MPGKKALLSSNIEYEVVYIDATETHIERPQKKQRQYYSGKKKRHTIKAQVVVNKPNREIICTSFSNGKRHDFRVFKESKVRILPDIKIVTDTGYQGIAKIHPNSELPKKQTKKNPLTAAEKEHNRKISSERVKNEHAIGFIKRFKVISEKYRNRRKRFKLRFNLIAGVCNYENNS